MHDIVWASPSSCPRSLMSYVSPIQPSTLGGMPVAPPSAVRCNGRKQGTPGRKPSMAPTLPDPPHPSFHTRWDAGGAAFSRPVRWLLALHGAATVPFASMGLVSSSVTRLLRNAPQPEMQVRIDGWGGEEGAAGSENGVDVKLRCVAAAPRGPEMQVPCACRRIRGWGGRGAGLCRCHGEDGRGEGGGKRLLTQAGSHHAGLAAHRNRVSSPHPTPQSSFLPPTRPSPLFPLAGSLR